LQYTWNKGRLKCLVHDLKNEGIVKAKAKGKYKERKATARAKSNKVKELIESGMTRQAVADKLDIGVASVYRILKRD